MTDVTEILINQVNHLESTEDGKVDRSEVIDLIVALEDDLYDMEMERAINNVLWKLDQNIIQAEEAFTELDAATDPLEMLLGEMFTGIGDIYYQDMQIAEDVLLFELEQLQ